VTDAELNRTHSHPLDQPLLDVHDLRVTYGHVNAVRGISFSVPAGKAVSLIGANGAGKSSTLASLAGLVRPSGGRVTFAGEDVTALPAHAAVSRGLVLVPEGRQILGRMTVAENLELGGYQRSDASALREETEEIYHRFPILGERRRLPAGSLSGGEQQMLAIARALMARPRLLMLDEPSMGLAPRLVNQVFEILKEVRDSGTTMLLVEQNARKALALTERGYVMQTGRIVLEGGSRQLLQDAGLLTAYLGTSKIEDNAL
jgi:branched-chain amino acid transport system ATP-binding protein